MPLLLLQRNNTSHMPTSPTTLKRFLLVLVVSTLVFEVAAGTKCPDGTDGLTKALYEAGDPSKYAAVSCIPKEEFSGYEGDIVIAKGLAYLTSVEHGAFEEMSGTLTFKGSFPLLSQIGQRAFDNTDSRGCKNRAGNADSKVELLGELVPKLSAIKDSTFHNFQGTVIFTGSFPLLSQIGAYAFESAGNVDSKVELLGELVPNLSALDTNAIGNFKGTLIFTGIFPLLSRIGSYAFLGGGNNADSKIEFLDGLPKLSAIDPNAFHSFKGTLILAGSFPLLSQIGSSAFIVMRNVDSKVELLGELVPKLSAIGDRAFADFKGTVIVKGSFPLLSQIGWKAFQNAGNADSKVVIACSSPSGLTVSSDAFLEFEGTHDATGEQCSCAAACAPCWVPGRVIDSKTCTTTTTTSTTITTTAITTTTITATTITTTTTTITTATFTTATTSATITTTTYTSSTTTVTSTTSTSTTTFTSTTTTAVLLCNGKADDAVCDQMDISACSHTASGFQAHVLKLCPVLCNTCKTVPLTNACICAGVALEGAGGSDCTSIYDGRRYCYVASGICSDSVESMAVAGFHSSYLACQDVQPGGEKAESEKAATDALDKHPVRAGEVVGIVLGVIILCGIVFIIVVLRRGGGADVGAGGASGDSSTILERCSNCKAKTQFCTCEVRRGTLDMAASKSVTVSGFVNDMYDATPTSTTATADEGLYDEPPAPGYLTVNA